MRLLILAVVSFALLMGCGNGGVPRREVSTPIVATPSTTRTVVTPAATSATAPPRVTATPQPIPTSSIRVAWDQPPLTGIPHIDALIAAIVAGDAAALTPYVTGRLLPCVNGDKFLPCNPGEAEGALIPTLSGGGCPDDGSTGRLTNSDSARMATAIASRRKLYLRSVFRVVNPKTIDYDSRVPGGTNYDLVFLSGPNQLRGSYYGITDRGIFESVGMSGHEPLCMSKFASPYFHNGTLLVAPP